MANNKTVNLHPKAKYISTLWKLNLRPKLHLFVWKLVQDILATRGKLRKLSINIDNASPLCNKTEEPLDHLFSTCDLAFNDWSTVDIHCPNPVKSSFVISDWMEYIWSYEN